MIGLGFSGGTIDAIAARWMFNSDHYAVPGVSYQMIVTATFFTVAGCYFKL